MRESQEQNCRPGPPPYVGGYGEKKGNLPRLERGNYQGFAVVFWTNTLEERAKGWLTPSFHAAFREVMLHAAVREGLACPAYCLMPDHLHLVWMGLREETDQLNAMKFLRMHLQPFLGVNRPWQHQAHDHVLRAEERMRNAFAILCRYTLDNPVRADLAAMGSEWPFSGCLCPGFPALNPFETNYWELFWKLYYSARDGVSSRRGEEAD